MLNRNGCQYVRVANPGVYAACFLLTPDSQCVCCLPVGGSVVLAIALEGIRAEIGPFPLGVVAEVPRIEQSPAESGTGGFAIQY